MAETETVPQVVETVGVPTITFTREQIELIKRTVAKGTTDDELALFLYTAKRTGLDPLIRQIHAVKRWDSSVNKEVMSPQTGIDGYRLIAERTGKYVPGEEPTFAYDKDNYLVSATAHVKKLVAGEWHIISATAFFSEYAAKKKDGGLTIMWSTKPHIMLGKCAEALALRKAFPAEMSGVYTMDEMDQANNAVTNAGSNPITDPKPKEVFMPGHKPSEKESPLKATFIPAAASEKKDKNDKTYWGVKDPQGTWYTTRNEHDGALLAEAWTKKQVVTVEYGINGTFKNLVSVKLAVDAAGDAQEN